MQAVNLPLQAWKRGLPNVYTIAKLFGLGVATIHNIVKEVCQAIINRLWKVSVQEHFPSTVQNFNDKMVDMEALWQFPCCWGAIDGCHISIQCPPGGPKVSKECHNFKNFYSIVMMAIVDAKDLFIWASVGFPGNSHDSVIFQTTELWHEITDGQNKKLSELIPARDAHSCDITNMEPLAP